MLQWSRLRQRRPLGLRGRPKSDRSDGMGSGHSRAVIAPSVQGWVLPHLIAWVESRGVNASPIRRLFGRTRLVDPSVRVPEAVTETAWRLAATLTRRRSARHPSRRVAAPWRARPHRVRAAIEPLSRERARSSGALWASAERSRGGADTPQGRKPVVSGPRHRHDAVAPGTSRICAGRGAQAGA